MDADRFHALTRSLTAAGSRRRALIAALHADLPDHSSLPRIANTPAPRIAAAFALSASQSTASGPLHRGDRTPIPQN